MKKILTYITEDDKCNGISLFSLMETLNTLLKIERYDLDKNSILDDLVNCTINIQKYWDIITEKYHIPLYVDRPMMIDSETNAVYVIS